MNQSNDDQTNSSNTVPNQISTPTSTQTPIPTSPDPVIPSPSPPPPPSPSSSPSPSLPSPAKTTSTSSVNSPTKPSASTTPVAQIPTKPPTPAPAAPSKETNTTDPSASTNRYTRVTNYRFVEQDIKALLIELASGPVVVAHFIPEKLKFYKNGVYSGEGCENAKVANHSVLAVGYDLKAPVPFILLKNSWGDKWGDKGYYRIAIGDLKNKSGLCLLANTPFNIVPEFN